MEEHQQLPLIKLIGDPVENFYQLGLKDRENIHILINHMKSLAKTPWPKLTSIIESGMQLTVNTVFKQSGSSKVKLEAYADGAGIPTKEILYTLLLPELMSCMSKWYPEIPKLLFGCSSFFALDSKSETPIHGRILDFSLVGSYDKFERIMLTKYTNEPAIYSYSSIGLPYPSLTAMNEYGVTLALHQKFTNSFDRSGTPIFELAHQLLANVKDRDDAIKFLGQARSITCWCFLLSFKDGTVLVADLMGKELIKKDFSLIPNEVLYFNNLPMSDSFNPKKFLPYGMVNYCEMRSKVASKICSKLQKGTISEEKLLKAMATPETKKGSDPAKWILGPTTPSSLTITTMSAATGRSLYIPGMAPKIFHGNIAEVKNIWEEPTQTIKEDRRTKIDRDYIEGIRKLSLAQAAFDQDDIQEAYHLSQLGVALLEEYPEGTIGQFFFLVYQFIHETHSRSQANLLEDFKEIKERLPSYLKDHATLFVLRLEIIVNGTTEINESDVQNSNLKRIVRFEKNIPSKFLHKTVSKTLAPRFELMDILGTM